MKSWPEPNRGVFMGEGLKGLRARGGGDDDVVGLPCGVPLDVVFDVEDRGVFVIRLGAFHVFGGKSLFELGLYLSGRERFRPPFGHEVGSLGIERPFAINLYNIV